jgi:transcriptional regulator with XRE-family HTH domain
MAKSITADVTPELLTWARESAGFDLAAVAKKTSYEAERIQAWEAGSAKPTVAQARALAAAYKRPFAVFFLASNTTASRAHHFP